MPAKGVCSTVQSSLTVGDLEIEICKDVTPLYLASTKILLFSEVL